MELLFALAAGAVLGMTFGRLTTSSPGEEEMFARLVEIRAERKIRGNIKEQLEKEVEAAAEAKAR